jgi:diguanylate cyclase (GGDEF)-like protein/PAS domain S-box-containing protein
MNAMVLEATLRIALTGRLSVLTAGGSFEALLGFSAEDFLSSKVSLKNLIHPHDSDLTRALFAHEIHPEPISFNIRLRHANGKIRCIKGYGTKTAGPGGEVILELLLQDAKSLLQLPDADAMLATLKTVMEKFEDFIYLKDRNHVFTNVSRVIAFSGDPFQDYIDLVGRTDYDFLPQAYADSSYRMEEQVFATKQMAHEVQEYVNPEGKKCWIDHRKYPITSENGEITGLFGIAHDISTQVRDREALRESKEFLSESQKIAGLGSYVIDLRTGEWTSSEVLDDLFGVDKRYPHTKEGWISLIHPEDRTQFIDYIATEVEGQGKSFNRKYRIIRQTDRETRWMHGRGRIELDAQSKPLRLRGTIQDITESERAAQKLKKSQEQLLLFIERAPVAIAMYDTEMRYLAVSNRWKEAYSLVGQDIIGKCHYDITPNIPERWKAMYRRGLAGESLKCDEELFEKADGSVQWIRWEMLPWRTSDDVIGGLVLFAEDITPQKQSEEHLSQAASVFTHASEGILITDANGKIINVNDMFSRTTGYSREEVLGRNPRLLKSGLQGPEFYEAMWRAIKEKGQWSGEIWNRNKNGNVYAEMLTINAVKDSDGKVLQYVALFSDITVLKEHEQQLDRVAHFDALTGLPNRALFGDRLRQAMVQSRRQKRLLAVACLDLDGFKAINDRYGHEAGDRFLEAVAHNMKQTLHEGDTLSRLGGDEFASVMLDLVDAAACEPMLDRLLEAAAKPVQVGSSFMHVSASVGVAFYPQSEEVDADQLLRQADQAMYQAKLAGRNRYHIFDPIQDHSVRGYHQDLERIDQALRADEFVLYYEPKVNMRTGTVIGAEALIRWQHPEQGLLLPAAFLPTIENHRLSIEVGTWVIDTVLTQMERWQTNGVDIPVSVNVSALQLQRKGFVEQLRARLEAHGGIEPRRLELEVLETSALQDVAQVSKVINACREFGVLFALDDFGTGYSSLTYLKRLPADILKIDQSFVRDILEDPESLSILEGILGLAAAFHRQVIAEGVETVEHELLLLQLGCEKAQGYGIARPMPAEKIPRWMATWHPDSRCQKAFVVKPENRPFLFAGVEHRAWILAINNFLKGKLLTAPGMEPSNCPFCAWLHTESKQLPALLHLETIHQKAHVQVAGLLLLSKQDRNQKWLAVRKALREVQAELMLQLEILLKTC